MKEENIAKNIGKKISSLRKNFNLTQEELGKIVAISTQSILKYESGNRLIPIDILIKVANYFKTSISYFLEDNVKIIDNTLKIPVVSVVSAGNGEYGLEDITDWIEYSENIFPVCDFATTVSGFWAYWHFQD